MLSYICYLIEVSQNIVGGYYHPHFTHIELKYWPGGTVSEWERPNWNHVCLVPEPFLLYHETFLR